MGTYYWTKTSDGMNMLIIEVGGRRWNYGSLVLDAVRRAVEQNALTPIDEILELERKHFSGWEMSNLKEEFEILKQTPEFQKLAKKEA